VEDPGLSGWEVGRLMCRSWTWSLGDTLLAHVPVFYQPAISDSRRTKYWNLGKHTPLYTTRSWDRTAVGQQPEVSTSVPGCRKAAESQWFMCCLQNRWHTPVFRRLHPNGHLQLQFQDSTLTEVFLRFVVSRKDDCFWVGCRIIDLSDGIHPYVVGQNGRFVKTEM
jgi:hypothetical protein